MDEKENLFGFEVDNDNARELTELSRWTKLYAIIVFCLMGVFVLVMGVAWNAFESSISDQTGQDGGIYMTTLAVVAFCFLVYFGIMVYFLLRSANRVKTSLVQRDQNVFNSGLADLKTFFVMMGVMGLLSLFFNLIALAFR